MNYAEQITKEISEAIKQLPLETQVEMLKEQNRVLLRSINSRDREIEMVRKERDYYHDRADYLDELNDRYIDELGYKITR